MSLGGEANLDELLVMRNLVINILAFSTLVSCAKSAPSAGPEESGGAVRWSVESVAGYPTRSLVENRDYLELACTPENQVYYNGGSVYDGKNGLGQTIGIWADYSIEIDGVRHEVTDVFSETKLIYNPQIECNDTGTTHWEYVGDPAYWVLGGEYVFRAYYPKSELNINTRLSNAKTLVIEMNTTQAQCDMLLAYNSVDTKKEGFSITEPVRMTFRHAMSALRFLFKFYDGSDGVYYSQDAIKSCWLEVDENESFAVTGYMIYGNGEDYSEGSIQWKSQYSPAKGERFYNWNSPLSDGTKFENRSPSDGAFDPQRDQTVATGYTTSTEAGADFIGGKYTKHDGWLVVIPQKNKGKLKLCFKTRHGGDVVFSVALPSRTGTCQEMYDRNPYDLTRHRSDDDSKNVDYIPGWRYTYTVAVSKTDADVSLEVAPWKRLDSSYEIKFN